MRRNRRALLVIVVGVVALVVVAAGLLQNNDEEGGEASLTVALSGTGGSSASGEIRGTPSGWRIDLDADLPRLDNGAFYEAWLRDGDGPLVPIGTFNEGEDVVLWAGVSPLEFNTLTVTREKADGNQDSSGDRVLTGEVVVAD